MTNLLALVIASPVGTLVLSAEDIVAEAIPKTVINRAGCMDVLQRLIGQGQLEAAQTYWRLIQQVTSVRYPTGYVLPWFSSGDMLSDCVEEGMAVDCIHFLYQANLLDFPQEDQPAVIYAKPGYSGEIRPIREGWILPPQQPVSPS